MLGGPELFPFLAAQEQVLAASMMAPRVTQGC